MTDQPTDPVTIGVTLSVATISDGTMRLQTLHIDEPALLDAVVAARSRGHDPGTWLQDVLALGARHLDDYTAWVLTWAGGRPFTSDQQTMHGLLGEPGQPS